MGVGVSSPTLPVRKPCTVCQEPASQRQTRVWFASFGNLGLQQGLPAGESWQLQWVHLPVPPELHSAHIFMRDHCRFPHILTLQSMESYLLYDLKTYMYTSASSLQHSKVSVDPAAVHCDRRDLPTLPLGGKTPRQREVLIASLELCASEFPHTTSSARYPLRTEGSSLREHSCIITQC